MEIRTSGGDKWCEGIVMSGGCCYEISTCVFHSRKDMCLKVYILLLVLLSNMQDEVEMGRNRKL